MRSLPPDAARKLKRLHQAHGQGLLHLSLEVLLGSQFAIVANQFFVRSDGSPEEDRRVLREAGLEPALQLTRRLGLETNYEGWLLGALALSALGRLEDLQAVRHTPPDPVPPARSIVPPRQDYRYALLMIVPPDRVASGQDPATTDARTVAAWLEFAEPWRCVPREEAKTLVASLDTASSAWRDAGLVLVQADLRTSSPELAAMRFAGTLRERLEAGGIIMEGLRFVALRSTAGFSVLKPGRGK